MPSRKENTRETQIIPPYLRKILGVFSTVASLGVIAEPVLANPPTPNQPNPTTIESPFYTYLPQIVEEEQDRYIEHSRAIFEAIKPYYPNLTEDGFLLLILGEDQQPGIGKSIRAWKYWLDRLYPPYEQALQRMSQAGIENRFFQNEPSRFFLNLLPDHAIAHTLFDINEQGVIEKIELEAHYGYPAALVGEWLHLVNRFPTQSRGISRVAVEGVSTLVDYKLMIQWMADNLKHMAEGTEGEAIVMPIFQQVSDTEAHLKTNPTLEEFQALMLESSGELLGLIKDSELYLDTYTSIEQFGVQRKLPGGMQLLNKYTGDLPGNEYHVTIENFANRFALEADPFTQSQEDVIFLSGLAVQGVDYPMDRLPENIRNALQAWYDRGLLYNSQQWAELLAPYSQINVTDLELGLHPVVTAKRGPEGYTDEVTIFAYGLRVWKDIEPTYQELATEDHPTAKLYFQHPNLEGETQWWSLDVPVTPYHEFGTFVFKAQLPETVILQSPVPRPVSLDGKKLVLNVNVDTIAGVPMSLHAHNLETIGHYRSFAANSAQETAPIAEPAEAPPENSQNVTATAVTSSELTEEQRSQLQRPDQSTENEVVVFGQDPDSAPKVTRGAADLAKQAETSSRKKIAVVDPEGAWRPEDLEELSRRLQAILDEENDKVE